MRILNEDDARVFNGLATALRRIDIICGHATMLPQATWWSGDSMPSIDNYGWMVVIYDNGLCVEYDV